MYSPQALWSAVHEEVPVVFVVLNNLEYGILKNFMLSQPQYNAKEHGFLAMDIFRPKVDFQSLARSMGVEPTFVNSHRGISEAVEPLSIPESRIWSRSPSRALLESESRLLIGASVELFYRERACFR
jgi:hypothetical protein